MTKTFSDGTECIATKYKSFDLVAILWVDITEYSGWGDSHEEPKPTWTVGFLFSENEDWLVLTDTLNPPEGGNKVYYPKGCIKKIVKLSKTKLK